MEYPKSLNMNILNLDNNPIFVNHHRMKVIDLTL
jgi:hypothetical protein